MAVREALVVQEGGAVVVLVVQADLAAEPAVVELVAAAVQEDLGVAVAPAGEVIDNFSIFCNFVPAPALTRHEN